MTNDFSSCRFIAVFSLSLRLLCPPSTRSNLFKIVFENVVNVLLLQLTDVFASLHFVIFFQSQVQNVNSSY